MPTREKHTLMKDTRVTFWIDPHLALACCSCPYNLSFCSSFTSDLSENCFRIYAQAYGVTNSWYLYSGESFRRMLKQSSFEIYHLSWGHVLFAKNLRQSESVQQNLVMWSSDVAQILFCHLCFQSCCLCDSQLLSKRLIFIPWFWVDYLLHDF